MILPSSSGNQTSVYTVRLFCNEMVLSYSVLLVDVVVGAPRQDGYFGRVGACRKIL